MSVDTRVVHLWRAGFPAMKTRERLLEEGSQYIKAVTVQTKSIADQKRAPRRRQLDNEHFQLEFSIKIMNPGRMSEFKNVRICKWKCCKTLNELRAFLSAEVSAIEVSGEKPDFEVADLGYIEPGHGMKGRKQWLSTDTSPRYRLGFSIKRPITTSSLY